MANNNNNNNNNNITFILTKRFYKVIFTPHNEKFTDIVEPIQYDAALAITDGMKGTSEEKLWMRRLCLFHKIYNLKITKIPSNLIPSVNCFLFFY